MGAGRRRKKEEEVTSLSFTSCICEGFVEFPFLFFLICLDGFAFEERKGAESAGRELLIVAWNAAGKAGLPSSCVLIFRSDPGITREERGGIGVGLFFFFFFSCERRHSRILKEIE